MYKSLISLFLLFAFIIAWLKPTIPYIQYELNKDYIQNYLCEKKELPENTCKGKCHLRKQIKKIADHNDEQNFPLPPKVNSEDYPIFELINQPKNYSNSQTKKSCYSTFDLYKYQFMTSIFHPPNKMLFV